VLEGLASFGSSGDIFVGFTLDLAERKRVEQERAALLEREREARQLAEEANRMKDEFLATISHELRTPLNAILGWTRLLTMGKLDPGSADRALETIERNARAQAQLIDDLLDVSRIMSGKLRLRVEAVDLARVVESALESVRPAATAKGITLATDLDRATGAVSGDANRLEQVVWNLLANAVKFTPLGGHVTVRLAAADTYAVVDISDSGPGIDEAFLPYVFERFRQADSSITRAHGGLGLGLAIVRHLTEIHGGTVSAANGPGGGAVFSVRLPLMGVTIDDSAVAGETDAREVALDGVRVLVVDDDKDSRDVVAVSLEQFGATVHTCASGEQALEELERWQADVLVSDVAMPRMDGHELVRRVRAGSNGHLPAIALTAYARGEDRKQTFASGFQAHLAKPYEPAKLAAVVARLARRHAQR
jgi:signal transduction histidine kinase/ActR/RegA family two-component response regulator